jgi:hypothetical protein
VLAHWQVNCYPQQAMSIEHRREPLLNCHI